MLSYCLKSKKIQKVKTQKLRKQRKEEQFFHQNEQCVIVQNQDLLKSKKQRGC